MALAPHMDCLQHDEDDSLCEKKVVDNDPEMGFNRVEVSDG